MYLFPSQFDCFRRLNKDKRDRKLLEAFPWIPIAQYFYFFGAPVILVPIMKALAYWIFGCSSFLYASLIAVSLIFAFYLFFLKLVMYPKARNRFGSE